MITVNKKIKIFDSDALKNFHKRIFFSIIVFLSFYFVAIFRIADVMLFDINNITNNLSIVKTDRGKIYDRNGNLLSTNVKTYSLYTNSLKIKNKKEISEKISSIIDINKDLINKKINSKKEFVYLKRNISPKEHQKILELGEINLQTHSESKRIYPFQHVSSHIVGYVDIDNKGIAGIEASYEEVLSSGKNIYLTLDIILQNAVRNELINTLNKFSAESGSAIIMDIKNSEILSINNYPDFDPNNVNLSTSEERLNRVLQSNYEMGSTFKPLTIAMAIDKNLITKDMKFDVSKPIKNTIRDWEPCKCLLTVKEILVKSSNIGTAKIANIIGKKNQKEFFKKIGFFDPIKINLIEAAKPMGQKHHWGVMETMTIGYGHGFAVTPLHLAMAYNTILNGGKKVNPKIILEDSYIDAKQIIKNETSEYINNLLRSVIEETKITGPKVKIDGYDIGGKTGTAELINSYGEYDKDSNRTIFVSAFPMSKPRYLILTFINKPQRMKDENYSITSATVNGPLVKNIILRMIEILNLPKQDNNPVLNAATSINYNITNVIN